eukprot:855704-Pleurochrysis_carterae.AAC.1
MMMWNDALDKLVSAGASLSEMKGVLYPRLLGLWAVALTTAFSILTVRMQSWRQFLTDEAPAHSGSERLAASAGSRGSGGSGGSGDVLGGLCDDGGTTSGSGR